MSKLDSVLDTITRNQRFTHYDVKVVMVPHEHPRMLNRKYLEQKAAIRADRTLTDEGKELATQQARATRNTAIKEWHEARLKNIDADLLEQRAKLISTDRPDAKRVDLMSVQLLKHTHDDIAVFYASANEDERRVIEAASAAVGRIPVKSRNGLEWKPLLDSEKVDAAILERAATTNPEAAARVRELTEIRAMQVTITGVALSEI